MTETTTELTLTLPESLHRHIKARVASRDQSRGKRSGFHVVYFVVIGDTEVVLLTIYAKAQQENLSPRDIKRLLSVLRD